MDTVTITANIPARSVARNGRVTNYPSRVETFVADADGRWSGKYGRMSEAEVIDVCRTASNWDEIKHAHFVMYDFSA